jgi:hypothetical protein
LSGILSVYTDINILSLYTDGFSEETNLVSKYLNKIPTEKGLSVIPLVFFEFLVVDD